MGARFYFQFDVEKAINAILYITGKVKKKDFHKIFKILYFADRDHFAEYGRPITGDSYIAMDDGPVPSKIYDILKSVRGDSFFKDDGTFSKLFKIHDSFLIQPLQEPNLRVLSGTDIKHLDQAIETYGPLSYDELKGKSHDYAWNRTSKDAPISFENILRETGENEEVLSFLLEQNSLANICLE
jgi:uncharacterized phage-associated protein